MATWFTSDEHYGHRNIIAYSGRPFANVDEMNEELVRRHNAAVQPGDMVYHLGDFSLDERLVPKYLPQLHGTHLLVPGNHDACHPRRSRWRAARKRYVGYGFLEVMGIAVRILHVQAEGLSILATHMPTSDGGDPRYEEWRPLVGDFDLLLHGHVHERWKRRGVMINVGVDQWGYAPVALDTLLELHRSSAA